MHASIGVDWKLSYPLYCEDNGRPVTNIPRRMFKAELLQYLYDWRDRDIAEHARYTVVKWFLELGVDEEPFDFTALSKFEKNECKITYRAVHGH
jgi:transposase